MNGSASAAEQVLPELSRARLAGATRKPTGPGEARSPLLNRVTSLPTGNCSGIEPRYIGLTGENAGESVEDRVTLLTQRREVAANTAEVISAVRATEAAGDLVLDFQHPQIALSLIVVKRHPEVVEEGQHGRAMRHQPVEQIAGRGLLGTSTLPGRFGGWVGPQSFSHESGEGGLVTGQPLGGQGRLSGGAGCRNHPLHAQ